MVKYKFIVSFFLFICSDFSVAYAEKKPFSFPQDTVSFQQRRGVTARAGQKSNHGDDLSRFNHLIGSPYNDILIGNDKNNVLDGNKGADKLYGGKGRDILRFSLEDHRAYGGEFANTSGDGASDIFMLTDLNKTKSEYAYIIADFEAGIDIIDLTQLNITAENVRIKTEHTAYPQIEIRKNGKLFSFGVQIVGNKPMRRDYIRMHGQDKKTTYIAQSQPTPHKPQITPKSSKTGKTAIFVLFGDSRTAYCKQDIKGNHPHILTWTDSKKKIEVANDPLEHINYPTAQSGFMIPFAKKYHKETGHNVLIIPAGQGGSGFADNRWMKKGALYQELLKRYHLAYNDAQNPFLAGIMGSIMTNNIATVKAETYLDDLIVRLRKDLKDASHKTPVILLETQEDFLKKGLLGRMGIQDILTDTPNRVPFVATISNKNIRSNHDILGNNDTTHDYDCQKIADRIPNALAKAKLRQYVSRSKRKPNTIHNADKITIERKGHYLIVKTAYHPIWYAPKPLIQKWQIYRSAHKNLSQPEFLAEYVTNDYTQKHILPAQPDGHYYFGKLVGYNHAGLRTYQTHNSYYYGP